MQAEVRLARGLIGERDADILQVRSINDQVLAATSARRMIDRPPIQLWLMSSLFLQYVEENDRVRAMLNEWSSRTAKVCLID